MLKIKNNKSVFGILGNKQNDIKFFINYLPLDKHIIIEPFGGSYALIRCVYYDDKYIKVVNDNDELTYYIYNHLEEYQNYVNQMRIILKNFEINYENKKLTYIDFKKYKEYEKDNINVNDTLHKIWCKNFLIRGRIIKNLKKPRDYWETIKISKSITFLNNDYLDVFNEYKYNENAFMFLDPPYMFSDNSTYQKFFMEKNGHDKKDFTINKYDNTKMIIDIYELFKDENTKCKIMFIINKLYFIEYLFKDFIKASYVITYQIAKKKHTILIITNY